MRNDFPTILSIKANFNPNSTHAVSVIGFNEKEFIYYDPGDGQEHKINYINDDFKNRVQSGDYYTLIIKEK